MMPKKVDDDLLLADLRRVARKIGKQTVTVRAYSVHGRYPEHTIRRRWRLWSIALQIADLKTASFAGRVRLTDADLLADIHRIAKRTRTRTLTTKQYLAEGGRHAPFLISKRLGSGSWSRALRAAGLKPEANQDTTRIPTAEFINDLKRVARQMHRPTLTRCEYQANGGRYDGGTITRRFGFWLKALAAAGLEPTARQTHRNIPDMKFLEDMRRVARQIGSRPLTQARYDANDARYCSETIARRFGSWRKALSMVILKAGRSHNTPRADLLADLREAARTTGKHTLTMEEYHAYSARRYHGSTIAKRFGTWRAAIQRARLQPARSERNIPNTKLLRDVQRVAHDLGRKTLTQREYEANGGRYAGATIAKRFGFWTAAIQKVGLIPKATQLGQETRGTPNADLLSDLRRVAKSIRKRTVTKKEYEANGGKCCSATIAKRFGSWAHALRAAGLAVKHEQYIPIEDLLANLRLVAERAGKRTITQKEYAAYGGQYSDNTFTKHWGSWGSALLAAGLSLTSFQLVHGDRILRRSLCALSSVPGLSMEDRLKVAKTRRELSDAMDDALLQTLTRMNLGPIELPSGVPSDGVMFWERAIAALREVQPDPEKLAKTGVLEKLGRQLHRAVAIEVLGREPLSTREERRVAEELERRATAV